MDRQFPACKPCRIKSIFCSMSDQDRIQGRDASRTDQSWFVTTSWTVVLHARDAGLDRAAAAWEQLCCAYWYPLYAYVRRQGHSPEDAQDLTQEFFARLLQKNALEAVHRERGRFRWFLLSAIKRFLTNEWNRAHALKRGAGVTVLSLDEVFAEARYAREPSHGLTPDKLFDQAWTLTLLEKTEHLLRSEMETAGKVEFFELTKGLLNGERSSSPYSELALELGLSEGALKVAVHRMRSRYRELLREQIAQTVTTPFEVEAEIRDLFAAFGD